MIEKNLKQGTRVDLQIMEMFPNLTRASIKKLILIGIIKINNEQKMPNYRPKDGDIVMYDEKKVKGYFKETKELELPETKMNLEILFEDDDTLVVYKPEGLNVHPVTKKDNDSLLNGLYFYMSNESKFNMQVRLRLVNRIDKETSGIVIASKNLQAHDYYSKQFEDHLVIKEYLCIVQGDFKKFLKNRKNIEITNYISSTSDNNRYYSTESHNGRLAKSKVSFLDYFNKFGDKKFSVLSVLIETGRTHQIRVHLSELGFPILGDTLYKGKKHSRLMLHAYKLTFKAFNTKTATEVTAKIPKEFED